jgi:hypothetical protein
MIEFDRTDGEEDLRGPYGPAGGTGWTDAIRTDVTKRLAEIVVESPGPVDLGRHWSRILDMPFAADGDGGRIEADMTAIQFARGDSAREMLRTLVIEVADRDGIEARAAQRGYLVSDAGVEMCGVRFRLMR